MISTQTVFVLGAGAHCSYNYPSGIELKRKCASCVRNSMHHSSSESLSNLALAGLAEFKDVTNVRCDEFATALQKSGQASIDAFINANLHQPGFEAIGKAAIAQVLMDYDRRELPVESEDDWLQYLFHTMVDGASSLGEFTRENRVEFVTFNYDRLLEKWMFERIKYSFGVDDDVAYSALKKFPIYHVYGMLEEFKISSDDSLSWTAASKNVRTIFDAEQDTSTIDAAKQSLSTAGRICLLGFGFHRENIELLDLIGYVRECTGEVASSRYGLSNTEWQRLTRSFPHGRIEAPNHHYRCLETLRNVAIF